MQFSKDSFCGFVLRIRFATRFSKDSTNLANPHESLVHRRTLDKQILNFWIRKSVCSSKDSFCGFVLRCGSQKIHFTDLICDAIFKRFDSRICFAKKKFQNYSICFDLEGFVYDSGILLIYPTKFLIMIHIIS